MGLLDNFIYPPVGFHFSVVIEMFPQTPQDFRFQSVSGLSVDIPLEPIADGGEQTAIAVHIRERHVLHPRAPLTAVCRGSARYDAAIIIAPLRVTHA